MINCLIVDDEPLALDLLEDNINRIPNLKLIGKCSNAFEAMQSLQKESIDLMIIDIQMPGLTGIQLLQSVTFPPLVIFVTAYEQYALKGYELNVVDYLLKPVDFERFVKAIHKASELHQLRLQKREAGPLTHSEPVEEQSSFFVNADYQHIRIHIADITHIEGLKDYIKIHLTTQSSPVITRMSLKSMEDRLSSSQFLRVHKSFIVGIKHVNALRRNRIMVGSTEVPVSDNYREAIDSLLGGNTLREG